MELREYVLVLQRYWRTVVAVVLIVVALTALATALTPREYRGHTQMYVSTSGGDSVSDLAQGGTFTQRQVATYADLATTPIVLEPVIDELALEDSTVGLAARTTATVPPNTVLIDIAVTDRDPVRAAETANSIGSHFATTVEELDRVSENAPSPVKVTVVQPAATPTTPASPQPLRNIALAAVLGLLLGYGLALLRDLVDTRVRNETDVQRVTDEPTIGAIAFDSDAAAHPLVVVDDQHSPRAEAFRTLRTNLRYIDADNPPRTMVLTSTIPGEGKSTTTANLALSLADSGASICLIEGDLRRPRLLEYLGLENAVGLTDVLVGRADLEDVLQSYGTNALSVLGCGPIPPNPSELLGSDSMARLLERLKDQFDYVIIDSPPLLAVTDGAVLSTMADGVVVVVGVGLVRREQLERALGTLERVDADVLGLVLNRLPGKGPDAYSYSYESYAAEEHRPSSGTGRRGVRLGRGSTKVKG